MEDDGHGRRRWKKRAPEEHEDDGDGIGHQDGPSGGAGMARQGDREGGGANAMMPSGSCGGARSASSWGDGAGRGGGSVGRWMGADGMAARDYHDDEDDDATVNSC
jgi:hypothetical protein